MRLTSVMENPKFGKPRTEVYRAQCLFLGEESFKFLAAKMSVARKILCTVHRIPFATVGSLDLSLAR